MKKYRLLLKLFLVFFLLLVSFVLRYQNFDKIPFPGESMDEYSYSWVGLSLIKIGIPVGISGIDGYKNTINSYENMDNVFQGTSGGNPQAINWPWFDHPPLLGLITGGYAITKGVTNFKETNIFIIRKPMLILGTASVFLVLLFGWINFGFTAGMVAGGIYGVMPVVVVGSRMIQGENGVIPAYLSSMVLLSIYYKSKNKWWLLGSGIMAGIACLFKLSGLIMILIGCLSLYRNRVSWKELMVYFFVPSLLIVGLFVFYGIAVDSKQFWITFLSNSNRFYGIGPEAIYRLVTQVKITNVKFLTDPFVLIGWIAWFVNTYKVKQNIGEKLLSQIGMGWILMYIILGSYAHGWYAFPFYPILALSLGRVFTLTLIKYNYFRGSLVLWLVGIGYFVSREIKIENFQQYASGWKYTVGSLIGLSLVSKLKIVRGTIMWCLLIILLGLAVRYLQMMTVDSWYGVL